MQALRPSSLLMLALAAGPATAQLAITEVLVDPVGANSGKQIVEISNPSASAFKPTGWNICAPFAYGPLPAISIPAGGVVRIHINATGTSTTSDFFVTLTDAFGSKRDLLAVDTFLLYKSGLFANSADIVDFVSWGGGTARITQAVSVKRWSNATATVTLPKTEGQSIARYAAAFAPESWYRDASPTLGTRNGVPVVSTLGKGCRTSVFVPALAHLKPVVDGNLDYRLRVNGAPAGGIALFLTGLTPANGVPVLGCTLEAIPDLLTLPAIANAKGEAEIAVPLSFKGIKTTGVTVYVQALVFDAKAPNAVFGMSAGQKIIIG